MENTLVSQTISDNNMLTAFNTESGEHFHNGCSALASDVKNEKNLLGDPILYYANKADLLDKNNYKQNQDLVLHMRDGKDQKKYVFNPKNKTLKRHDSCGTKYYNKNDEETKREKFLLIYELKKLYLEKEENEYTQKLQKGEFYDYNLVVEDNSSQKNSLEEKIKSIDTVINVLNDQNSNYGRSFGEQINSFIETLNDLKKFSGNLHKAEWYEQAKFINELENRLMSVSLEENDAINSDGNKEKQFQLIGNCIKIYSKDFKIEHLKNSREYIDLNHARPKEFFGGLIRDIKHQVLVIRKKQIEKELDKTKSIQKEIRIKQDEIRKIKGDWSNVYQISDKDEERYSRLLKAQQSRTNQEYRDGLSRTKEKTEEDKHKIGIRNSQYDVASEKKDVEDITQTINKEYLRIKTKEEYIVNKIQEATNLREDMIPTLEVERDLLPIFVSGLDIILDKFKEQTNKLNILEEKAEGEINRIEVDNGCNAVAIKNYYKELCNLLTEIENLKIEINRLKTAKAAVRQEEESAFKERIFLQVGGQRSDYYSPDGYCNHKSCPATLPGETICQYKNAVKDSVSFSLSKFPSDITTTTKDLFKHLSGYKHSAVCDAVHADDLRMIPRHVYESYSEVQNKITERENEYQNQIVKNECTQQRYETKRDELRTDIVTTENILNDRNITLSEKEREKENYACQRNNDNLVNYINDSKDVLIQKQVFINNEIVIKEDEITEIVFNIRDKRLEINELEAELHKDGEYNEKLAFSKARYDYSQYEKIVTTIGDLKKQKTLHKRLEEELNAIQKKLEQNKFHKSLLNDELNIKTVAIKKNLDDTVSLVMKKNNLITKRSRLLEMDVELVNAIEICRKNITNLKKQQDTEIKAMNKARSSIIRRKVYSTIYLAKKGVTKTDESIVEDIGTENQLYKKRRHKNCQDIFEKINQACKYFDVIDIIIKILLETDSKSNVDIINEVRVKNEHYKNHVLIMHLEDITEIIGIIRDKIAEFNNEVNEIKSRYTIKQEPINQSIDKNKQKLFERKKLDGVIYIKNLVSETEEQDTRNVQDNLDIGADCVVIDQTIIYTRTRSKFTINEFIAEITLGNELPIDIKSEALKLLTSRKAISLEAVLLQKKDTNQKTFYKLLVQYFNKEYLKMKLEIVDLLDYQEVLKTEKREITREIARIYKEDEKLLDLEFNLKFYLSFNSNEIARLNATLNTIVRDEREDFKQMKDLYTKWLEHAKGKTKFAVEAIKLCAEQVKELKNKIKLVDCSQDCLLKIKSKIVKNHFKIGLHLGKYLKHRDCDNECDFHEKVERLIEYTINDIQRGMISIRAPDYKVSNEYQNKLIAQIKIKVGHSKKHENAFRRVVSYVAEEYGQKRETARIKHNNKINELEWKIAKIDLEKNAINQIVIQELKNRITEMDNYFVFLKDLSFIGKNTGSEDITQKELTEYKKDKFTVLFKYQVDYLITTLNTIENNLNRIKITETTKPIFHNNSTTIKDEANTVITCIYEVFKKYYDDLKIDNQLIPQLISKLEQELRMENHDSRIKSLIKKKSIPRGGTEYIFKKISWLYHHNQQEYNTLLDPEKIYNQILFEENQKKEKAEADSLKILQNELLVLEAQKKELYLQDNSILREELENIDICIRYIENLKDVDSLRTRIEELDDSRYNKDDYYLFEMDNRRLCVRLLSTDPIDKSAEIKEIDKIRNYIKRQNFNLLEKKVLREEYDQKLKEEIAKGFRGSFIEIQKKLLIKGISLCGYDAFENGRQLDIVNGFISVIIGTLIGESNLYQIGSINEANRKVEGWIRKIRLKYNEFVQINEVTKPDEIQFIINAVNKEFINDNLFISQINIISNKQNEELLCFTQQPSDPKYCRIITLLKQETQYFSLVPRDKINIYKNDEQSDLCIKLTNILAVLQTEEDLFKYLCQKRLQDVFRITLEHYKKLGVYYKREKSNLTKISSIKEFNALFCNILELTDNSDSQSIYLFGLLAYLEKLEYSIQKDDPHEKIARLKIVKNLYDNALVTIIKAEQQRRQKENATHSNESREELYIKEMIKDREGKLELLLQDIRSQEQNIEKDQELVNSLLFEKESTRDKYRNKIEQLSNIAVDLKDRLKSAQERIRILNKNEKDNQKEIKLVQEEVTRLEAELAEIDEKIKLKKIDQDILEREIREFEKQAQDLECDLKRVNAEKEIKENEESEKRQEIEVAKDIIQFIQNLKSILSNADLQSKKEEILKSIYFSNNLKTLLEELRKELEKLSAANETTFWQLLINNIDYEQLKQYLDKDKKIAGELQYNLVNRLRAIIRDSVNIECEIVQEFVKDKPIKRFKLKVTNVNYKDIHEKIKRYVEKEIIETIGGLSFLGDFLHSTEYGITGINDLPNELKALIIRRIELHYKSEEVESKKNAKFGDAVKIINELNIDYKDVVQCYVNEIEIIASGKFILNDSSSYPGISLTISAVDMECVGENLTLDTSGKNGAKFRHKASDGCNKRINSNQPRGDKGFDGYDGDHGSHGGNIVIKIENTIINYEALASVKANGGNGGEGQLGGNGDEGLKGMTGKNGEAKNTNSFGGGQTTIGFGSPGTRGGCGGAPGGTGRPGMGGKAGVIDIVHKPGKITTAEMNQGQDADNILDKSKPNGGDGGEPGLYGMDQIKDKKNFFSKTKTFPTLIDRQALMKKCPKYRDQILAAEDVNSTNYGPLVGLILAGGIGFIAGAFWDSRLVYEETDSSIDYRNRNRNHKNMRGRQNEEEAQLRSDYRVPQQDKVDLINIDSLHSKLNEKKIDEKEISGEVLHKENICDLEAEQEELDNDIEKCTQEASNIQCEIENVELTIETKNLELDKILIDVALLKNSKLNLDTEMIGKINQIIRSITNSQNLRDKQRKLDLNMSQILAKLENYNTLGEEFYYSKEDLIRIIDEYLEAVRDRLKRSRRDLKFSKNNFARKQSDIKALNRKSEDLRQERLSQIVKEDEIDQEIEEEAEDQYVEKITHLVDLEDRKVYLNDKYDKKQEVSEDSYSTTKNLFDFQNIPNTLAEIKFILDQSVKHYRAGVVVNDETVKSIIEALNKKNEQVNFIKDDFKEILQSYKNEINKIRISNNIDTLSSIERNLLLDNLKKISNRLEIDHFANLSDDKTVEEFLLKLIKVIDKDVEKEQNIAKKLQLRFEQQYLLDHDRLKYDIDSLIGIIDGRKTFYLEKCAINFSHESFQQTDCEKAMLAHNNQANLENLKFVVNKFKLHQEHVLTTKIGEEFSKEYLQSIHGFILTVLENIKYHAVIVLSNLRENNKKNTGLQENNLELIKVIINNIKTIKGVNYETILPVIQITMIIVLFSKIIKHLKDEKTKSKKETNKAIKSLEAVTKKLIKYIDINYDSPEISKIVDNYLALSDTELVPENSVKEIIEDLESKEERLKKKTPEQMQNDEATADSRY